MYGRIVLYYGTDYNFMLQDTENLEELEQLVMAITVITKAGASISDSPKDIGIVIEGVEVITGLARACAVLLVLTYALNLIIPGN